MSSQATLSPLDQHRSPTASVGRRSGRAVTALILGILAVLTSIIPLVAIVLGVIAIVLGATARSDIRRNRCLGAGQAKAAIILGSVGIVLAIGWIVLAVSI